MSVYAEGLIDGVSYSVHIRYRIPSLDFKGNFWNGSISSMLHIVRCEINERYSRYSELPVSVCFKQLKTKESCYE